MRSRWTISSDHSKSSIGEDLHMRGNQANGQDKRLTGFEHLMGDIYMIGGCRWKVIKLQYRRKCIFARLRCLDQKNTHRSTTVDFLQMIKKQKVS
ncbi:hypothetical protein ACFYU8_29905 [Brevibacillus sp. NPDC003359]|uniref:hypothetical protein n=1 Tax=unclassified Brevibacillus TaxID=2684853 RepID=UPI00367D3AEF